MRAVVALLLVLLATASASADPVAQDRWLMLVRTENTDPAQEAAFNHWYDDIDIPDVLEVPGYQRARRGAAQPAAANAGRGRYLALYDIHSSAIEQTIELMNRLARDMPKQGRSTPLLEVTERIYYSLHRETREGTPAVQASPTFLVLSRFDASEKSDAAYDATLATTLATPGVLRATRYQLYRVRMDQPFETARFLTVFEVAAPDAAQARDLVTKQPATDVDTSVFAQIKDVARPVAN